jgi:RNA polymerase sigma factor (sigma-70 family)
MSAEFGGGCTEDRLAADAPIGASQSTVTQLYDQYAAHLLDYCVSILRDPVAAADGLQDTLIAADAQMGKLRDPDRLRVWLYAIARRQCLSNVARGSGISTPADFFQDLPAPGDDDTAEIELPDVEAEARDRQKLLIVMAAMDGLSDSDREVLNLAFRHAIHSADLAVVLGVSGRRAGALLTGACSRFEESSTAAVVLGAGWAGCQALEAIVGVWDSGSATLTPPLRKRLTRHIDSCDRCTRIRGGWVFGPELLADVPVVAPPLALRERITKTVLDTEPGSYRRGVTRRIGQLDDDGFPVQPKDRRGALWGIAAAAALVVLIGAGALIYQLTSARTAAQNRTATTVATGSPTPDPASSSLTASSAVRNHAGRAARSPFPGQLGPSLQAGVLPVPPPVLPSQSPSPSPTRSHKPKPSPSPSRSHKPKPSPSPTPTPTSTSTPTPTPTPTVTPPD